MLAAFAGLSDLADDLRRLGEPLTGDWDRAWKVFEPWAARPGLAGGLRAILQSLSPAEATEVTARSRETTTHFAWCIADRPGDPFTFWINEYKSLRDWRAGYADSIHNHRYHFCTTILTGGYLHEYFRVVLDPEGRTVTAATLADRGLRGAGSATRLLADEFHRIPEVSEGTITFLVKSRPVKGWSLSFDLDRERSRRHVPIEARLADLIERL